MPINQSRIKTNIEDFSFPRLSGTKYEKQAFSIAKKKIHDLGLEPQIQKFKFSTFYSRIYPKITFPITFWIVLTFYLKLPPFFLIGNLFIISLFFLPFFIATRKPEKIRFGKVLKSQNLFLKLNRNTIASTHELQQKEIKNIFFIAHLDSKGQRFIARTRFLSILSYTFSLITLGVIIFLRDTILLQISLILSIISFFPLVINFVSVLILTLNTTNNDSKGVVDDASGVACVLELIHHYRNPKNRINGVNLWFVLTGAEETGTMGIRNFYETIKHLNTENTLINNFESLGKSVAVFISKNNLENNPEYYDQFEKKAAKYNFRTQVSSVNRGVHTDGIYLFQKGFNLFEFGSTDVGKHMHSEYDTLGNVDVSVLKKLCDFLVELLDETQSII